MGLGSTPTVDPMTENERTELAETLTAILEALPPQGTGRDSRARGFLVAKIQGLTED